MSHKVTQELLESSSSKSASFNTSSIDMRGLNQGSFQVVITTGGAVSWTVVIQGSNDDSTFIDLASPTSVTASDNLMFGFNDLVCLYYRVKFTRTSGTLSTVAVTVGAKG
jgi:hypothetical protein